MNYLLSQGDQVGWGKTEMEVYYEMICATKITVIAKCTSVCS